MSKPSELTLWKHLSKFAPGTLIRADSMNNKLDGIAESLEQLRAVLTENIITLPNTFSGSGEIPEKAIEDSFIYARLDGNMDVMPYVLLEQRLRLSPRIIMPDPITEDYVLDYAFADQRYYTVDSPNDVLFQISTDASTPIDGAVIYINRKGAGNVTIVALDGVTINSAATTVLRAQHSTAMLVYRGNNEWDLGGDLVAVD